MAKIICILLLLIYLTLNKKFVNSIIQITNNSLNEIHNANILPNNYGINHFLDSKIEGTQIAFLSPTLLEIYYSSSIEDQLIHLIKLDFSSSQPIIYNDFLKISLYHPYGSPSDVFYISKILSVNPLIIYINTRSIIN